MRKSSQAYNFIDWIWVSILLSEKQRVAYLLCLLGTYTARVVYAWQAYQDCKIQLRCPRSTAVYLMKDCWPLVNSLEEADLPTEKDSDLLS